MKVMIEDQAGVLVIHLSGRINYESLETFQATCTKHLHDKKVVFNMAELSFVGSFGITPFVETVTHLYSEQPENFRFCGVGSEFRRVFESSEVSGIEIFDSSEGARASFFQPAPMPTMIEPTYSASPSLSVPLEPEEERSILEYIPPIIPERFE